jgi:hypothetical protein
MSFSTALFWMSMFFQAGWFGGGHSSVLLHPVAAWKANNPYVVPAITAPVVTPPIAPLAPPIVPMP